MESSIKIDLGVHNYPVIRIKQVLTDDVRDQLLSQFKSRLEQASNLCFIEFTDRTYGTEMIISPIESDSSMYINRLCESQLRDIIYNALVALSPTDREKVINKVANSAK